MLKQKIASNQSINLGLTKNAPSLCDPYSKSTHSLRRTSLQSNHVNRALLLELWQVIRHTKIVRRFVLCDTFAQTGQEHKNGSEYTFKYDTPPFSAPRGRKGCLEDVCSDVSMLRI